VEDGDGSAAGCCAPIVGVGGAAPIVEVGGGVSAGVDGCALVVMVGVIGSRCFALRVVIEALCFATSASRRLLVICRLMICSPLVLASVSCWERLISSRVIVDFATDWAVANAVCWVVRC
jgi:hypothetical protein